MKLSNKIADQYFLHAEDTHAETKSRCCFFSNKLEKDGWGFWVRPDGTVDVDDESSNGELPSPTIVAACVRAAKKYLAK